MAVTSEVVYFELNNWFSGKDYPNQEPFISWLSNDINIQFRNEAWVRENGLCVVSSFVDMSSNFCVTATKKWVEDICPKLLTDFKVFLRYPDEDGIVYGRFGHEFLPYEKDNIGITEI